MTEAEVVDLGGEFAVFAAESLEWAEATWATGLSSWLHQGR